MNRFTEEMKLWLFDLAHGNLKKEDIVKGFIKYYVIFDCVIGNVADDIRFHTVYGCEGVKTAIDSLREALKEFIIDVN